MRAHFEHGARSGLVFGFGVHTEAWIEESCVVDSELAHFCFEGLEFTGDIDAEAHAGL